VLRLQFMLLVPAMPRLEISRAAVEGVTCNLVDRFHRYHRRVAPKEGVTAASRRATAACAGHGAAQSAGEQRTLHGVGRAPAVTLMRSQMPVFAPTEQVSQPAVSSCMLLAGA
jgi:hypothetical protein